MRNLCIFAFWCKYEPFLGKFLEKSLGQYQNGGGEAHFRTLEVFWSNCSVQNKPNLNKIVIEFSVFSAVDHCRQILLCETGCSLQSLADWWQGAYHLEVLSCCWPCLLLGYCYDRHHLVRPCHPLLCQYLRLAALHREERPQPWGVYGAVPKGRISKIILSFFDWF